MKHGPIAMVMIAALSAVALSLSMTGVAVAQLNNSTLFNNAPVNTSPPPAWTNPAVERQPQRPKIGLVKCDNTHGLACNAPFCLKVRTKAWDQLPSSLAGAPEVYIQFTRQVRDQHGQALPSYRFKVALEPGSDHERELRFQMDGGPLFLDTRLKAFLSYPASLGDASPDDTPFDIDLTQSRVTYQLTGDSCEKTSWFLPAWW